VREAATAHDRLIVEKPSVRRIEGGAMFTRAWSDRSNGRALAMTVSASFVWPGAWVLEAKERR
jgi:hypothetical protein